MPSYLLRKAGKVVGQLTQDDDGIDLGIEDKALADAVLGFLDLQAVDAVPVEGNVLAAECEEDRHRACDLSLVVSWAADFARTNHIVAPRIQQLAEDYAASSEDEVRQALEELIAATPDDGELRAEAAGYLSFLYQQPAA